MKKRLSIGTLVIGSTLLAAILAGCGGGKNPEAMPETRVGAPAAQKF
jgi:hypothetical protein